MTTLKKIYDQFVFAEKRVTEFMQDHPDAEISKTITKAFDSTLVDLQIFNKTMDILEDGIEKKELKKTGKKK